MLQKQAGGPLDLRRIEKERKRIGKDLLLPKLTPDKGYSLRKSSTHDKHFTFTFIHLAEFFIQSDLQFLYVRGHTPLEQLGVTVFLDCLHTFSGN